MVKDVTHVFKIITLGDNNTGKSSFLHYLGESETSIISAIDVNYVTYRRNFLDFRLGIQIWDYFGETLPRRVYYHSARAIFLFFDISKLETLRALKDMFIEALEMWNGKPAICVLIGNKIDLDHQIKRSNISKFMEEIKHPNLSKFYFVEMSVLRGINVLKPFDIIIPHLMEVELRCYNCFKIDENVQLGFRYMFCPACRDDPDYNKAKAFKRLVKG